MSIDVVIPFLTKVICLLLISLYPASAIGQVAAGDIVVIRVNNAGADGNDSFTWLALNDLESPELLWSDSSWGVRIDDQGVRQGWSFENSNGMGTSWLPSGTILAGTTGEVTLVGGGLAPQDQLFIFSGPRPNSDAGYRATEEDINFVFGMTFGEPWATSGAVNNSKSYEPESIRNLGVSIALGPGTHWHYTGTTSGTAAQLLAEIRNPANWTASDDENSKHSWAEISGSDFEIVAVPEPATFAFAAGACGLLLALRKRRHTSG